MNLCFIIGKIISDIEFKFIVNDRNKMSISLFILELSNKSKIKIEGYNNMADFCYQKLSKDDIVVIEGYINSKMNIVACNAINFFDFNNKYLKIDILNKR